MQTYLVFVNWNIHSKNGRFLYKIDGISFKIDSFYVQHRCYFVKKRQIFRKNRWFSFKINRFSFQKAKIFFKEERSKEVWRYNRSQEHFSAFKVLPPWHGTPFSMAWNFLLHRVELVVIMCINVSFPTVIYPFIIVFTILHTLKPFTYTN